MYRIARDEDKYILERKKRFLFFTWWSRNYKKGFLITHYQYDTLEQAERMRDYLNNPQKKITSTQP